jgi:hypothetical protein
MVGLSREQRRTLADKLPDMANVAVGGMVFGQFLSDRPFSPLLALSGLVLWALVIATVVFLGRRKAQ